MSQNSRVPSHDVPRLGAVDIAFRPYPYVPPNTGDAATNRADAVALQYVSTAAIPNASSTHDPATLFGALAPAAGRPSRTQKPGAIIFRTRIP